MVIEFNKGGNKFIRFFVQPEQTEGTSGTEGTAGKKVGKQDVPVGQSQKPADKSLVGLDTFVRPTEASAVDLLAEYNKTAVKKSDNMPRVNTSPVATETRLTSDFERYNSYIADEVHISTMATVRGLDQALLTGLEENPTYAAFLNPQLAQYLNVGEHARIGRGMHIQEIDQYA